ncbi:hypothetical protein [Nocardia sp. NPDC005745]|uniref:hypothetical protein n=1 Tax=Nocardia sp. NPDC005745 TaxID=3157061 RepID=UPI0033F47C83
MTGAVIPAEDINTVIARTAVLAALLKRIKKDHDLARNELRQRMSRGMKLTGLDPRTDDSLGTATMSDPKQVANVTDPTAFDDWIRTTYPDRLTERTVFGRTDEIAAVLKEHAPHLLLRDTQVISSALRDEALKVAATTDVPGTKRSRPDPTLTVRETSAAHRLVRDLLAGNPVPVELTSAPKALEARADG